MVHSRLPARGKSAASSPPTRGWERPGPANSGLGSGAGSDWSFGTIAPRGLEAPSASPDAPASTPAPAGLEAGVLQLRGKNIPTAEALVESAGKGTFTKVISSTRTYEDMVESVERYYDNSKTPTDNYGMQLWRLKEMRQSVAAWEAKHGDSSLPETSRFLIGGETTESKRRKVVHSVKTKLDAEVDLVKFQGWHTATTRHKKDRRDLASYVYEGATSDERRLANSCEWILNGKVPLFAVTETGDAFMRVKERGGNAASQTAYFPRGMPGAPGDMMNNIVNYDRSDYADANVTIDSKTTGGWNIAGGVIAIVNPSAKGKEGVWGTLRHEVQHDADKNRGRDAQAGVRGASEAFHAHGGSVVDQVGGGKKVLGGTTAAADFAKAQAEKDLQRYKTEYRAYSYQEGSGGGPYTDLDNTDRTFKTFGGVPFTERQFKIFSHIYLGYEHTKNNWDKNSELQGGRTFREAVSDYRDPDTEGFNKYNSVRVDAFYTALDAVGTKAVQTDLEKYFGIDAGRVTALDTNKLPEDALVPPAFTNLMGAAGKLDADDARYVESECPAMLAKLRRHLSSDLVDLVLFEVGQANSKAEFDKLLKKLEDLNR